MKKQHVSPALIRVIAGFIVGVAITALGMWMLGIDKQGIGTAFMTFVLILLSQPVYGLLLLPLMFMPVLFEASIGPIIAASIILCFYPILMMIVFYLAGAKQTRRIVIIESCVVVALVLLSIVGWFGAHSAWFGL